MPSIILHIVKLIRVLKNQLLIWNNASLVMVLGRIWALGGGKEKWEGEIEGGGSRCSLRGGGDSRRWRVTPGDGG